MSTLKKELGGSKMCGIIGYIGPKSAMNILLDGLSRLEYRGYDSAGVSIHTGSDLVTEKAVGRLQELVDVLEAKPIEGHIGIGHTRWATHGRPSELNSHPHTDCHGRFSVVHNGIIENYLALREELIQKGHRFVSETDTEVIAHLLEEYYEGDFLKGVQKVLKAVKGAYSLVFISKMHPEKLICAKKDNPLVIGLGEGENFIASDIPAIIPHTRKTFILNDGEVAEVSADQVTIFDDSGKIITKKVYEIHWDAEAAEKDGYEHFMLKEIHEQPKAVQDTLRGRIVNGQVAFEDLDWTEEKIKSFNKIYIVACGTAYHAGLQAKIWIEKMIRTPVFVEIASEFKYREPLIDEKTLVIVVSQSGETSDTLTALREAKRLGAATIAIVNSVGSSIAREADQVLYTWAGPEISVASTKAYTTQIVLLFLLSVFLGRKVGGVTEEEEKRYLKELEELPELIGDVLKCDYKCKEFASSFAPNHPNFFFIGRLRDYASALEGALKLKEISYIHAEAYPAGELKHGTFALIEEGVPVISLFTEERVMDKMVNNVQELKARGTVVCGIGLREFEEWKSHVDHAILLPPCDSLLAPMIVVIPLQLIAYYAAVALKRDVDKPRNLAKSVTVE